MIDDIDIHAALEARRAIAVIWCIEDVLEVRPDLSHEQCWEVLRETRRHHDAGIGINWDVLHCHARWFFGPAPESTEQDEED
jgi:hypothetical protein